MTANETHYQTDADEAKRSGLRPHQQHITVRWETISGRETDDAGQRVVDEIIATGCRLEMMDESNCWMNVNGLRVWIRAMRIKGQREPRLVITAEPESCAPVTRPASSAGATPALGAATGDVGRSRAELDFIRDRVLAEIREHPSQRPYLGEPDPRPRKATCKHGHVVVSRTASGMCSECDRSRKRATR